MNGLLIIDKPGGRTSFSVCAAVRRALNVKRVGHVGTLDPLATGVLPVLIGQAARLADFLPDTEKRYSAGFQLGITTDTLDTDGKILTEKNVSVPPDRLLSAINGYVGEIEQLPPMYSAIKIDGKPLYSLARQGVEVERKRRFVTINSIKLSSFDGTRGVVEVSCSRGTYIRTLIDDIGASLGCGAVVTSLCRTFSGGFDIADCVTLENFLSSPAQHLQNAEKAIAHLPRVDVTQKQAKRFLCGGALSLQRLSINEKSDYYRIYSDTLCGVGELTADSIKPKVPLTLQE